MAEFVEPDEMSRYRSILSDLLDFDEGLSSWEIDFIDSLNNWDGEFTVKQAEILEKVCERRL